MMVLTVIVLALGAYILIVSRMAKGRSASSRTARITAPLSMIISFAPLAAAAVFAVLFATVLKGRLTERSAHALLVLTMWMYAARFYQYIISYFKERSMLICSAAGMAASAALAILLTPLERYVELVYMHLGMWSIVLGIVSLAIFYGTAFASGKGLIKK